MDCRAGCEAREGDDACAEPDARADAPDGWTCGEALGLAPGTRARCEGGRLAEEETCALGCEAGACVMEDPCVHATLGNGWYCAASLEAGEEGVRYRCVDGATAEMERCAHGCAVQPPGSPDLCGAGERVGLSGGTGWSTGPHAHVQRQERCASWWCQSVALRFDDFPRRDGVPASGDAVTSANCR